MPPRLSAAFLLSLLCSLHLLVADGSADEEAILQLLQSEALEERLEGSRRLQELEVVPDAFLPVLFEGLKNKREGRTQKERVQEIIFRKSLTDGLAACGHRGVPALREAMKDDSLRWSVIEILYRLGPDAVDALPEIRTALTDENQSVRYFAAKACGAIGVQAKSAIPDLIDALSDSYDSVRQFSAQSLGLIGEASPEVVRALLKMQADPDRNTFYAEDALEVLDFKMSDYIPELVDVMGGNMLVPDAIESYFNEHLEQVIPEMINAFERHEETSYLYWRLNDYLKQDVALAAPLLREALAREHESCRRAALSELLDLTGSKREKRELVLAHLDDRYASVRRVAFGNLTATDLAGDEQKRLMLAGLEDSSSRVQQACLKYLAWNNFVGEEELVQVQALCEDSEERVAAAAHFVLLKCLDEAPESKRYLFGRLRSAREEVVYEVLGYLETLHGEERVSGFEEELAKVIAEKGEEDPIRQMLFYFQQEQLGKDPFRPLKEQMQESLEELE